MSGFGQYDTSAQPTNLNADGETWYDARVSEARLNRTRLVVPAASVHTA